MSHALPLPRACDCPTSFFRSGEVIRSRSVSDVVLSAVLDVPAPSARLAADWDREISSQLGLEPGDVEPLPLARARARWPQYKHCVQAAADWTRSLGLHDLLTTSDIALMACRGARYHHDGTQYGGAAFCNLFISEDKGLDVHFPVTSRRVPLVRGTALVFDASQPHAVIKRNGNGFSAADFAPDLNCTQVFLTWELPIDNVDVARALAIDFDIERSIASRLDEEQVWWNGAPLDVCAKTGQRRRG